MDREKIFLKERLFSAVKSIKENFFAWFGGIAYLGKQGHILARRSWGPAYVFKSFIFLFIVLPLTSLAMLPKYLKGERPNLDKKMEEVIKRETTLLREPPDKNYKIELSCGNQGRYQRLVYVSHVATCDFRIARDEKDKTVKVIISQLPNKKDVSLTLFYDKFATEIFWNSLYFNTRIENIEWYDYWPNGETYDSPGEPVVNKVFLKWNRRYFYEPVWMKIKIPEWLEAKIA